MLARVLNDGCRKHWGFLPRPLIVYSIHPLDPKTVYMNIYFWPSLSDRFSWPWIFSLSQFSSLKISIQEPYCSYTLPQTCSGKVLLVKIIWCWEKILPRISGVNLCPFQIWIPEFWSIQISKCTFKRWRFGQGGVSASQKCF